MAISLSAGVLLRADDFVVSRFSDYLDALRIQAGIPGLAVALIRADEVNWTQAYGRRDIEKNLPTERSTAFQLDGTTEIVTTALVLRCVEEGRLTLDERVSRYSPELAGNADLDVTIRQALSHTTVTSDGLAYSYRPDRQNALAAAVVACRKVTFRQAVSDLLYQFNMFDSVPGTDAATMPQGTNVDPAVAATVARYASVLERLAKPYAVDSKGRATASSFTVSTIQPVNGLISTVDDLARFDLVLRKADYVRAETLNAAWTPPLERNGLRLPHGLGWFVQQFNGERIVWQYGVSDNASSSMVITVPARGLTLILLANSQGLSRPFSLSAGDVMVSPFARLFLQVFVR
jgi:CubicO group peptidase (beta-lactamase class C family)